VFDALGFAAMIADDEGVLDAWNRARATGEEGNVPLPRPIPVRLFYQTAFVENGRVVIAPDIYGWDEEVAEALGLPPRARPVAPAPVRDLGP
jgi:murein L,D-transpeptidase YcbB/YkuD